MAPFSKLKSSVAVLALLLLLIMSSMMTIAAQSNFKHGRKLMQGFYDPYAPQRNPGSYSYQPEEAKMISSAATDQKEGGGSDVDVAANEGGGGDDLAMYVPSPRKVHTF
ncbi:hypothetical protein QL285_064344 [Trifolium repens]|nr:hypothetical protein QL285_064344 [Trifolium repens]